MPLLDFYDQVFTHTTSFWLCECLFLISCHLVFNPHVFLPCCYLFFSCRTFQHLILLQPQTSYYFPLLSLMVGSVGSFAPVRVMLTCSSLSKVLHCRRLCRSGSFLLDGTAWYVWSRVCRRIWDDKWVF